MMKSGLTLQQAMEVLEKSTSQKEIYQKILSNLKEGKAFSQIMKENKKTLKISESELSLLTAGEESGEFLLVIETLADYHKNLNKIINQIKSLIYYPLFLLVLMLAVFCFIYFFVLPEMLSLFEELDASLPTLTLWLINVLEYPSANPITFIFFAIIFLFILRSITYSRRDWFLRQMIHWPIIGGLYKKHLLFVFIKPFLMMLKKKLPMKFILEGLKSSFKSNPLLRDLVGDMGQSVSSGTLLGTAFNKSALFSTKEKELIAIAEQSGHFLEMMIKIDEANDEQYENHLRITVSFIEPLLIGVMGIGIVLFLILFILPLIQMDISGL